MELTFHGHSCIRLRGRDAVVVCDPWPAGKQAGLAKITPSLVTVSTHHPDHDHVAGLGGTPRILDAPGEYEVASVPVIGVQSETLEGALNTIFVIDCDEVTVAHLGALGKVPAARDLEHLAGVHVLVVPAGGRDTLPLRDLADLVAQIDPRVIIPVGYLDPPVVIDAQPLEAFLKTFGVTTVEPKQRLTLTRSTVPDDTQVVVLAR